MPSNDITCHVCVSLFQFINAGDLMKCHITGVLNHGEKKFHTFVDYNQYSHDPNLTVNVILKVLWWTASKKVSHLHFFSYNIVETMAF